MATWLKANFGLVFTFIGLAADIVTLYALFDNDRAVTNPRINYTLSLITKITIWSIALVAYLAILKESWIRTYRRYHLSPPITFGSYITEIFQFKHLWLLIPFLILAGFLLGIFVQMGGFFWFLLVVAVLILAVLYLWDRQINSENEEWELVENDEVYHLWVARIDKEIADVGFATSYDLSRLFSQSLSLCDKFLRAYFSEFESNKDLVLLTDVIRIRKGENSIHTLVVARRTLTHSKPWYSDPRR